MKNKGTNTPAIVAHYLCIVVAMLILFTPCLMDAADKPQPQPQQQGFVMSKDKEIQHIAPKKPVRVKLHRSAKGEYSWDLTGDSVDEVVRADKRLKKQLNLE
jgi:hypothetical protein